MEHLRSNWRTYLLALVGIGALSVLFFLVLLPMFGVALHLFSLVKVAAILLLAGAVLRFLLHAVDGVDRKHGGHTTSGR